MMSFRTLWTLDSTVDSTTNRSPVADDVAAAWFGRFDAEIDAVEPVELRQACEVLARRYSRAALDRHQPE